MKDAEEDIAKARSWLHEMYLAKNGKMELRHYIPIHLPPKVLPLWDRDTTKASSDENFIHRRHDIWHEHNALQCKSLQCLYRKHPIANDTIINRTPHHVQESNDIISKYPTALTFSTTSNSPLMPRHPQPIVPRTFINRASSWLTQRQLPRLLMRCPGTVLPHSWDVLPHSLRGKEKTRWLFLVVT